MRNINSWVASKYDVKNSKLIVSKDSKKINTGSRIIANCVANFYTRDIPKYAHGKLLDLGCGEAPLYAFYRDHVTDVVCADWKTSTHDLSYVDFHIDMTKSLPFKNDTFDTVIMSDVLEHISRPFDTLQEVSRIIVPGGHLILNVPFLYWIHEAPHDYFRYTEFGLRSICENYALKVIELSPIGGVPEVLGDLLAKISIRIPLLKYIVPHLINITLLYLLRFRWVKQLSNSSSNLFPLGYFLVAQKF